MIFNHFPKIAGGIAIIVILIYGGWWVGSGFEHYRGRFEKVEKDIIVLDRRLTRVEVKLDNLTERVDKLEERVERLEVKVDRMDEKLDFIISIIRPSAALAPSKPK